MAVDRTETFNNNFEHLLQQLLAVRRPHVVVVAHGNERMGLIMPLAAETDVSAGYCMPNLVALIEALDRAANGGPAVDQQWLSNSVAHDWKVTSDKALSIAAACRRIRAADDICVSVHVRGCNIGKEIRHLDHLRQIFRARRVTAPNCSMFFVPVVPTVPRDFDAHVRRTAVRGRRVVHEQPPLGRLLLDIRDAGPGRFTAFSAIERLADLPGWATHMYVGGQAAQRDRFPVAGMWPDEGSTYSLAHEPAYRDHLVLSMAS